MSLYVSKQREDLFIINDSDYVACYQINYKMYENKIINTEIPTNNFQNFLFLLKYYQLYKSQAQFDYLTPEELSNSIIYLMEKHLQTLFKKNENNVQSPYPQAEIIQTETGIKIMQMKQEEENEMRQNSIIAENNKIYFDYYKNRQNNLLKNEMNDNLFINLVKFIKIFESLNLLHEINLDLLSFILNKSIDFFIHLMNHKELWLGEIFWNYAKNIYVVNYFYLKM